MELTIDQLLEMLEKETIEDLDLLASLIDN